MYEAEIRHDGLKRFRVLKAKDRHVLEHMVAAQQAQWEDMWARRLAADAKRSAKEREAQEREAKKALAAERTAAVQAGLHGLRALLARTLTVNDAIDWEALKDRSAFPKARPVMPPAPQPTSSEPGPAEPRDTDAKYQLRKTIADRLFPHRWSAKVEAAEALFKLDHNNWSANIAEWRRRIAQWEAERAEFDADQARYNHAIDRDRDLYMNREPDAIVDYCQKVLWRSKYPEFFPRDYDVDYVAATRTLIVDYVLPSPRDIPQIRQVKYVQSHDQLVDVNLNDSEFAVLYDNILYQVSLRTIHELYEADVIDAIASIAFNGYVDSLDPRTGHAVRPCVLSLTTRRDEFMDVNLHNVDPKACFKKLKGVAASQLHSLTAVAPIMQMNRQDRRFVAPKAVAHAVDAGNNLAAMHWEDFEHLIRELFEKEFSQDGGEVRITQASRDQGVDAIAFNPDPIRGGKIVIQAKRYTNTVGVSAVRDLYGTVMNEGATKGILVTTADYGPDAYEFARDKPLTLMNGSNLLHLLETHGHRARIDLIEAKQQLAAEERTRR